jgi:hypothetical protein
LVTGALLWGIVTAVRATPGDVTSVASQVAPSKTWAWRTPDAHGVVRYSDLITKPVPVAAMAAAISRENARTVADSLGFGGMAPGEPRISLRYATRLPDAVPNGFQDRVAWIVEYPNSPMMVLGPPGLSEEDRRKMEESGICDFVIVIDATTGKELASLQSCRNA